MDLPDKTGGPAPTTPPPQKKVPKQIVEGAVKVPRPATRRFFDFLFAESPKAVGRKIASDVIVPRIKQGFEEAANSFLSGMLWGGNRPTGLISGSTMRGGATAYSAISTGMGSSLLQARQATEVQRVSYEDLAFPTLEAAEFCLANMIELLNQYRVVAIGDLNDMVGNTSQPSDNAYGWNNLDGARISKDRNGFRLELPRPTLI